MFDLPYSQQEWPGITNEFFCFDKWHNQQFFFLKSGITNDLYINNWSAIQKGLSLIQSLQYNLVPLNLEFLKNQNTRLEIDQ
jgi:hypothetical protein